ncbi:MAG: S8 family serine peptidase [Candidatus Thorarchaeota archaeon]
MREKRIFIACLIIIMLGTTVPFLVQPKMVDAQQLQLESSISDRLAPDLLQSISESSDDSRFDVIVRCDNDVYPEYMNLTKDSIIDLKVTIDWGKFGLFRAEVTKSQLLELVDFPYVVWIDPNRMGEICLDSARYASNVDLIRDLHPELNGDSDGSIYDYSKDDIVIAILDTGIDTNHIDLDDNPGNDKVLVFKDFINDLDDFTPPIEGYDDHGHGTHVASTAAGTGEGQWKYRGVAPYAALIGIKMASSSGSFLVSDAIDALIWVSDHKVQYGIDIVSMSFGSINGGIYDNLAYAADLVAEDDIVVLAAAGNYRWYIPNSRYVTSPGTGKYVITVGSGEDGGWTLSSFSAWGKSSLGYIKPDIIGPGEDVWAAEAGSGNDYIPMSGTSMATPFIAGLAALWLDHDITLKNHGLGTDVHPKVKHLLTASARDMQDDPDPGKDYKRGAGRIDAVHNWDFLESQDISDSFSDAPLVIDYSWYERSYPHTNEPLWVWDSGYYYFLGGDYYKVNAEVGIFIYAEAWGDPDLLLKIRIYDKNHNLLTQSYIGNHRSCGWTASYRGAYYIRVSAENLSGDWYDITISTTPS